MLRVKKDVDLNILKKYGFKEETVSLGYGQKYTAWNYTLNNESRYCGKLRKTSTQLTVIGDDFTRINHQKIEKRKIVFRTNSSKFLDILYDMFEDRIIEKIDEKKAKIEELKAQIRKLEEG